MKKLLLLVTIFCTLFAGFYFVLNFLEMNSRPTRQWDVQSIDTMKFSRDRAREVLNGGMSENEIQERINAIAQTGATHVAIGTPYDPEFIPVLKLWVKVARQNNLKVWFRSNFSGWEGWFGYADIDKATHTAKVKTFIESNPDLFENGDIFTSCTECENGHKVEYGDGKQIAEHRKFIIGEYNVAKEAFKSINKNVKANYYSMNGDLALAMMDKDTTQKLDGIVVVDHYVTDPKVLAQDLRVLAEQSGGTVILGEFGAPVPDLHGEMTEEEQMLWVKTLLGELAKIPEVVGINYWVDRDGSTAIWSIKGKPTLTVDVLTKYYKGQEVVIKSNK